jgi:hypothetical protein
MAPDNLFLGITKLTPAFTARIEIFELFATLTGVVAGDTVDWLWLFSIAV